MSILSVNGNTVLDTGMMPPCRLATTGPITLSGLFAIDGVTPNAGDRILVWQQTDATTNGIYAANTGAWVRTSDAASNTDFFDGMRVAIAQGQTYIAQSFQCTCTDDPVVVGTSQLTFETVSDLQMSAQSSPSSTSLTVGTGTQNLSVAAGLSFSANQWVLIFDAGGNEMLGQITAYNAISGALAVSVVATGGSGTHSDWTVVLTNSSASAGLMPPVGTGNTTGAGSSTAGHIATFADGTGKVLADSGIPAGALAGRTTLQYGDAGTASISQASLAPGAAPLPYVATQLDDNLHIENSGTGIDVTAGRVRDDSDATNLHLAGTIVKRLDQAWAAGGTVGTPAGACDTGTKGANQTWHVYLIGKLAQAITLVSRTSNVATITAAAHGAGVGGTVRVQGIGSGFDAIATITAITTNTISYANSGSNVGATAANGVADLFDVLASQSYPTPTFPSGWTVKQCLGSVMTDGSTNILAFTQRGDEFCFATPPLPVNNVTVTSTASLLASGTPNGVRVRAFYNLNLGGTELLYLSSPDDVDLPPQSISTPLGLGGATFELQVSVWTNASSQIRGHSSASAGIYLALLGYRDPRRRMF